MKKLIKYILILSVVAISCNNSEIDQFCTIKDFIRAEKSISYNIDSVNTNDKFLELFDTIPSEFGYKLFNEIIEPIPIDSFDFKRLWNWEIDTITNVLAAKTNKIFDKNKSLSDDTYFLIVYFVSVENYPFAGTIYADLKREKLGTYMIDGDSVKFSQIELAGDSLIIDNLNKKLKIYKR